MNIRVDLNIPIKDGTEVVFRSPVDCSQVTGLILYYPENGITASKEFAFADAHGNNVGDIDHLFAENVAVKVILDVTTGMAFVQNADTNAYLESRFDEKPGKVTEDGGIVFNDTCTASAKNAVSFGNSTQASGENAVTFGKGTKATARNAISFGLNNESNGIHSFTASRNNKANSTCAVVLGENNISPETAKLAGQTICGRYNAYADGSIDRGLFVVGCGNGESTRRNAMVVKSDGSVDISGQLSAGAIAPNTAQTIVKYTDKSSYSDGYPGDNKTFLGKPGDYAGQIGVLVDSGIGEATVYIYCGNYIGWIKIAEDIK